MKTETIESLQLTIKAQNEEIERLRAELEKVNKPIYTSQEEMANAVLKERGSIYNWEDVPEKVEWLVTEKGGCVEAWSEEPVISDGYNWFDKGTEDGVDGFVEYKNDLPPFSGDWKQSKERRPR